MRICGNTTQIMRKLMTDMKDELTELEYLQWFYNEADFGPAHGDVVGSINDYIEEQTGKSIPGDYKDD